MMTLSFPVCRYISKCKQLSHCSYNNRIICFQSVKIIYRHIIAIYHQDFLFFEDFEDLFLSFFYIFSAACTVMILNNLNAPQRHVWASFDLKNT